MIPTIFYHSGNIIPNLNKNEKRGQVPFLIFIIKKTPGFVPGSLRLSV